MKFPEKSLTEAIRTFLSHDAEDTQVTIVSQETAPVTKPGDNFMCIISSLKVVAEVSVKDAKTQIKTFDFIAKHGPENKDRLHSLKCMKIFDKEYQAYKSILPQLRSIAHSIDADLPFPQCYYASLDEMILIMEDLRASGYGMMDKKGGLDLTHIKTVFEKLANFHAVSYHYLQTYRGGIEQFRKDFPLIVAREWLNMEGQAYNGDVMFKGIFGNVVLVLRDVIRTEESKRLASKVETFMSQDLYNACTEYISPKEAKFRVLDHGDCWSNNFLFKPSSQGPTVAMIDLQIIRYGPPSTDLWYCLNSATSLNWRREHLSTVLKHYHSHLSKQLTALEYDPVKLLPYDTFLKQFDACYGFGYMAGNMLALVTQQNQDDGMVFDPDVDAVESKLPDYQERMTKRFIEGCKKNKPLRERLLELSQEAEERGLLC